MTAYKRLSIDNKSKSLCVVCLLFRVLSQHHLTLFFPEDRQGDPHFYWGLRYNDLSKVT